MTHPQKKERTNPVVGPSRSLTVEGRCPMGCGKTLFLGEGGHVTCSWIECPNPCAADDLLSRSLHDAEVGRLRKERDDAKEYVLRVERQRNALLDAVARLQQVESEDEKIEAERDLLALAVLPNPDAVEGEGNG